MQMACITSLGSTVLQGMIGGLNEIGRCYGMEIKRKKLRVCESQGNNSQYRL